MRHGTDENPSIHLSSAEKTAARIPEAEKSTAAEAPGQKVAEYGKASKGPAEIAADNTSVAANFTAAKALEQNVAEESKYEAWSVWVSCTRSDCQR